MKFSISIDLDCVKRNAAGCETTTGDGVAKLLNSIGESLKGRDIEKEFSGDSKPLARSNTGAIRLPDGTAAGAWTVK